MSTDAAWEAWSQSRLLDTTKPSPTYYEAFQAGREAERHPDLSNPEVVDAIFADALRVVGEERRIRQQHRKKDSSWFRMIWKSRTPGI